MRRLLPLLALSTAGLLALPAAAQCDAYVLQPDLHLTGADPSGLAFAHLDGDAYLDMVVSGYGAQDVKILLGTPGGGFGTPVAVPAGAYPVAVATGDLDGDGDLDLAVADEGLNGASGWQGYGFTVLWNSGGAFASSSFFALPAGAIQPRDIALGDFDGVQGLDVALVVRGTGNNQSKLASFLNDGNGGFGPASLASTNFDPVALALGDLNGDQVLDAVTVNSYSGTLSILDGTGSGTFTQVFGHSVGVTPTDVALADIDGDGDLDGAVSYRYGVHVLRNTAGILDWAATLPAGFFPSSVACADLDGNGAVDLAALDGLGDTLYLWDGDGGGAFAPRTSFVVGDQPFDLTPCDVDGDGETDLGLVAYLDGGVVVLQSTCPLSTYCVGKVNSLGCTPAIGSTGTPSLSGADDFHVTASQELSQTVGLAAFALAPATKPFAGATLCVQPPITRTAGQGSGGTVGPKDCTGTFDLHVTQAWMSARGWTSGTDVFAQYWSRDPQHPDGTSASLSNALRFVVQP